MFKDPMIRRFVSSSIFAGTFVWVAVYFFDVDPEVVWVLLGFCVVFVLGLIIIGLVLAPLIRLLRRKPPLLSRLEQEEADRESDR